MPDPEHTAENDAVPVAVPDARTGRLLVKWRGVRYSLTPDEWEAFKVDPPRDIPPDKG